MEPTQENAEYIFTEFDPLEPMPILLIVRPPRFIADYNKNDKKEKDQ